MSEVQESYNMIYDKNVEKPILLSQPYHFGKVKIPTGVIPSNCAGTVLSG